MLIRAARYDDVGYIGSLWLELVAYHRALDPALPQAAPDGDERYARHIYQRLNQPGSTVFVAVDERGRIVGYVYGFILELVPDTFIQERGGLLADIYVQPHARRRGLGKALYRAIMQWFRQQGIQKVEWDVAAQNTTGRAFWQAMGGREVMVRMIINVEEN